MAFPKHVPKVSCPPIFEDLRVEVSVSVSCHLSVSVLNRAGRPRVAWVNKDMLISIK